MSKKLAIIFDISTLMYRGLHSKVDLDTEFPVARKTLKYIMNILNEYKPNYIAIAIDSNRDNIYRKTISKEYKSNRKERPIEISEGLEKIREFCKLFDIKIVENEIQEADDIIASLVKNFTDNGIYSIVCTTDGDLTQLHSKYCKIGKLTRDSIKVLRTWKSVKENFGKIQVDKPSQVRDFLSIVSDKSDGIIGVKGIGNKRALELIRKYGDIKSMFDSEDDLPYNLRDYKDLVFKNRNLIKLYNKINVGNIDNYKYDNFDYDKCMNWLIKNGLEAKLFNQVIDLDF